MKKHPDLHPLCGVGEGVGAVEEGGVLHVLGEALQEAEWLVENYRHCDLGQLLRKTFYHGIMTGRRGTPIHDATIKAFFNPQCELSCFFSFFKIEPICIFYQVLFKMWGIKSGARS